MINRDLARAPSTHRLQPWLVRALVLIALAAGLLLGMLSVRLGHFAVQSGRLWLAFALETSIDALAPMGAASMAVIVLRWAEPRKFWLAAAILVLPLIGMHHSLAYHPLVVAFAEASWFLVVLCCARSKRTLGLWCVAACAACTTGIQLESSALKHSAQALQAEVLDTRPFATPRASR